VKIITEEITKLNKTAVEILVENINKLLKEQQRVILGIPGGRSVKGIFALLKNEKRIPWKNVHIFMVDERLVPLSSEESNFKLANDAFIDSLVLENKLPKENIHPFIAKSGISDYENELKKYGKSYDIIILSSGEDCHVGSLYPDHASIKSESEYYVIMNDAPKPPPERMSISRKMILKSKVAIILFIGESKRKAYQTFLSEGDFYSCPARLVKMIKNSYVLTDLK